MIELKHLGKIYSSASGSVEALKDVNLTIADGEIFGIIGLSGAGKSTLVRCINLLERPTQGEVLIDGKDLTQLPHKQLLLARRSIGMIFQDFNLLEQRTVLKNVLFPLELTGMKLLRKRSLLELSGGEVQRAFLAQLLAQEPEILLLDEPANHLDLVYQQNLFSLIGQWLQTPGRAALSVVHDLSIARRYGTHAVLMNEGRAVAQGPIEAVFTPENLQKVYSMDVYGWMNDLYALWQEPVETLRRPG